MEDELKFFTLNTGTKIPSIGLGTWQSEPGVVGEAITTAIKAGYRHVDCAAIYRNEAEVGQALRKLFENGTVKREDLFITSKIWCTDLAAEDVRGALNKTLSDLQLDYVDLYLIHWPCHLKRGSSFNGENILPLDMPTTWSAMEQLYDDGKARAIGVSNFTCKTLGNLLAIARVPPAVNQVECNPIWQQTKLRTFCQENGVHLSGFSPLGSPGTAGVHGNVLEHPIVKMAAEKLGKSPAQVALRWGVQMGHSVLPKSTKEARIKENLDILDWSLPDHLFSKFSEIKQTRLLKAEFLVHENGIYRRVEELWDGEV